MKIVIDIPKKLYEYMTHSATISNKEAVQWFVDFHKRIFVDGTPLPKGHGRLIDAEALLEKLGMLGVTNAYDRPSFWYGKDKKDYKVIPTKYHNGYDNALADVEKAIQELQTIEERKGKWILTKRNGILCGVCHSGFRRMPTLEGKPMFNYCPLCGARMEGADNER